MTTAPITEEFFLRTIDVSGLRFDYGVTTAEDGEVLRRHVQSTHDVRYQGGSVAGWMQEWLAGFLHANPWIRDPFTATFNFIKPIECSVRGRTVTLHAVMLKVNPRVGWSEETVVLEIKAHGHTVVLIGGLDMPHDCEPAQLTDLVRPEDLVVAVECLP
jgi:hypothetical protein